jgi:hypothetical protein
MARLAAWVQASRPLAQIRRICPVGAPDVTNTTHDGFS